MFSKHTQTILSIYAIISSRKQNMLHEQTFPQGLNFNFPEFGEATSIKFPQQLRIMLFLSYIGSILSSNVHTDCRLQACRPVSTVPHYKLSLQQDDFILAACSGYYILPGFTKSDKVMAFLRLQILVVFKLRQVARCYFRVSSKFETKRGCFLILET